jgi:hypothetical protein
LTCSSLNLNSVHFVWTNPYWVIQCGEMCLLVLWCVGGECDISGNSEDRDRSRRVGVEDRGWLDTSQVLNDRMIGRSVDAVCNPYRTRGGDEKHGFSSLASKLVAMVCQLYGLKNIVTISLFWSQNKVGWGLSVYTSKLMSGWKRCEDTRRHPTTYF